MVFVYLGEKLPRYANASIEIAEKLSGLDISLLGNSILRKQIHHSNIEFIPLEDFYSPINYMEIVSKINMPLTFRNGFWGKTLERLFVLQQYMEKYNVQNVFHAELDQILFRCDKLLNHLEDSKFRGIAFPFHTIDKGVASILYCNDVKSLESIVNFTKELPSFNNEMELIAQWAINNPHMVKLLPTIASEVKKSDIFQRSRLEIFSPSTIGGVADATQIGQWIGGQDPRNVNIRNAPKNKFVESPSEEILSLNDLLKLDLKLTLDGSLLITYDASKTYNLYNVHLHSKIHPWIIKSHENLDKLIEYSNKPEEIVLSGSRWIQISDFVSTGIHSVKSHPIDFLKRFLARLLKMRT